MYEGEWSCFDVTLGAKGALPKASPQPSKRTAPASRSVVNAEASRSKRASPSGSQESTELAPTSPEAHPRRAVVREPFGAMSVGIWVRTDAVWTPSADIGIHHDDAPLLCTAERCVPQLGTRWCSAPECPGSGKMRIAARPIGTPGQLPREPRARRALLLELEQDPQLLPLLQAYAQDWEPEPPPPSPIGWASDGHTAFPLEVGLQGLAAASGAGTAALGGALRVGTKLDALDA